MSDPLDALLSVEPELLVAHLTPAGRLVHRNEAWERVLGDADDPWQRLSDDDRALAARYLGEAGGGQMTTAQVFFVGDAPDAEQRPVLLNFLPVYVEAPDGPVVGAVLVDGEVLAEPATWTQNQTQQHRLESLGRMTMGIAHDFNNLLSSILGHLELLKSSAEEVPPGVREPLATVEQAALDGAALVHKIQQYLRQEKRAEFEPLQLNEVIEDCVALTRPYWFNEPRRQGIAIEAELDLHDVPPILGTPAELRDVFVNLVLNAVQAMPEGGTLTFATRRTADGHVAASLQDTGTGMPAHVQARIFEPLYTTKGKRGSGMGLAVSHGIVQDHDGRIDVASTPGAGTTFTLTFPPAPDTAPLPVDAGAAPPSRPARVLVVDDEKMVRTILDKLLALRGHTVVQAGSGAEALALIDRDRFDIVFTDLGMPEMNGRELAHAIRRRTDLPIVLLTGDTQVGAEDDAIDRVLTKPFKLDTLDATIRDLL